MMSKEKATAVMVLETPLTNPTPLSHLHIKLQENRSFVSASACYWAQTKKKYQFILCGLQCFMPSSIILPVDI